MSTREQQAQSYYEQSRQRVKETQPPACQKFMPGTRVRIADDLGPGMRHFPAGKTGTVLYTYAHAYGGNNVRSYCIDIDEIGEVSWYYAEQLSAV